MPEFATWYLQLKAAHFGPELASGGLSALRGALVLAGQGGAMTKPWRMISYGIDTAPPALYIVLGSLALKRARSTAVRCASHIGALLVYLFMVSVARAYQPLGFLQPWMTHGG